MSACPSPPGVKTGPPLPGELLADLLALVGDVNAVLDPDELLPAIARKLRRIVDYRILDIFLPDAEGFLAPAHVEGYDLELASRFRVRVGRGHRGRGGGGARAGVRARRLEGPALHPVLPRGRGRARDPAASSKDRLVGVLNIEGPAVEPFTPAARTALQVLAGPPRGGDRERDALPRDALVRGAARDALRDRQGDGLDPRPRRAAAAAGRDRQAGDRLRDVRHPAARRGAARARAAQGRQLRPGQGAQPAAGQRGPVRRGRAQPASRSWSATCARTRAT